MQKCYKCGTEGELSLKRSAGQGNAKYICKPCRREAHSKWKATNPPRPTKVPKSAKAWAQFAKEKNGSIIHKYADTSFLIARGIL
jgi:hypothetical protein